MPIFICEIERVKTMLNVFIHILTIFPN
jgi:hypothetical protein